MELKAGVELFAYYGYKSSIFPSDFLWYWEAKTAVERQERLEEEERKRQERVDSGGETQTKKKKTNKKLKKENATKLP
jgi:hypothetical protein